MTQPTAQTRMKAMVAARLLMGDFNSWDAFDSERKMAVQIANRRTARSVSAQIGRSYRDLTAETQKFIAENLSRPGYDDLAKLCEDIPVGVGIYLRLDEFEIKHFPLASHITQRFPFHAHVSISLWGLQFEFPEHHFLRDLESALNDLEEVSTRLLQFQRDRLDPKEARGELAILTAREKFLCRSIISAAFNLIEAFISGLFFEAVRKGSIGTLPCDPEFCTYATKKESAPLRDRIEKVVKFVSRGGSTGADEPFRSLIDVGKLYRDAIHHTTPFGRKDIEEGERLTALYKLEGSVALLIALQSFDVVLKISGWAYGASGTTVIAEECKRLRGKADELLRGDSGSVKV